MTNKIIPLLLFIAITLLPQMSETAFYEYVDENGVRHFTDYQGDIPEKTFEKVLEHKDKYDYMSEEEKKKALKEEQQQQLLEEERRALKKKKRQRLQQLQQLAEEVKKQQRRRRTRVVIQNNQIHVPVTLSHNGDSITTTLLLDTGANSTVIHDSVARQLGLDTKSYGSARIAGGGVIRTSISALDSIQVGQKKIHTQNILVMKYKGPPGGTHGLLGLDFLKHFKHTIDFQNHYINWIN